MILLPEQMSNGRTAISCGANDTGKDRRRSPLSVLDLFAGCGGSSTGFIQAGGFQVVGACEWDEKRPAIAMTYEANHPNTEMLYADITLEETKQAICRLFQHRRCDVMIGSPPCGTFSTSGRRNPDDPRGRLFLDYIDLVGRLRPEAIVMENVIGILWRRKDEDAPAVDRIKHGLRNLGYRVEHQVLNAADYGVPQNRRRVIIVAAKPGIRIRFPHPTHVEDASLFNDRLPWITMRDAIGDLADAPEDKDSWHVFTDHDPDFKKRMQRTPFGGNCGGIFGDGYRRDWPDRPSSIIKTVAWPIHYAHPRTLSYREAARLQSFPDSFRFVGKKKTDVATMIGNAVPCGLARAIGKAVFGMLRPEPPLPKRPFRECVPLGCGDGANDMNRQDTTREGRMASEGGQRLAPAILHYGVVLADPPWRYRDCSPNRRIENHYPTMPTDDICALRVPSGEDAVLYLWATAPMLVDALRVMGAWGFAYKSCLVWDKVRLGMGYWFRGQHELLLVGTKGRFRPPIPSLRISSVLRIPRTIHSRKPAEVRELIARWYPGERKLEMFAREKAENWDAWGNEVESDVAIGAGTAGGPARINVTTRATA